MVKFAKLRVKLNHNLNIAFEKGNDLMRQMVTTQICENLAVRYQ